MRRITIKYTDGAVETYNTEDWDDYKMIDNCFCVRKNRCNVGIFNMKYVKSIIID